MNHTPAGAGLDSRSEFIAQSALYDSLTVDYAVALHELEETRQALSDIIHRVHNTYHAKGVSKPPWELCKRTSCRLAQQALLTPESEDVVSERKETEKETPAT